MAKQENWQRIEAVRLADSSIRLSTHTRIGDSEHFRDSVTEYPSMDKAVNDRKSLRTSSTAMEYVGRGFQLPPLLVVTAGLYNDAIDLFNSRPLGNDSLTHDIAAFVVLLAATVVKIHYRESKLGAQNQLSALDELSKSGESAFAKTYSKIE